MLCVFFCFPALCDAILEGFPFSVDINALFVCFQAFNDIQLGGAALLLNTCLGNCSMIQVTLLLPLHGHVHLFNVTTHICMDIAITRLAKCGNAGSLRFLAGWAAISIPGHLC